MREETILFFVAVHCLASRQQAAATGEQRRERERLQPLYILYTHIHMYTYCTCTQTRKDIEAPDTLFKSTISEERGLLGWGGAT